MSTIPMAISVWIACLSHGVKDACVDLHSQLTHDLHKKIYQRTNSNILIY